MTSRNYLLKTIGGNIRRNFWLMILFFLAFLVVMPASTLTALDGAKYIDTTNFTVNMTNTFIQCIRSSLVQVIVAGCGALAALSVFFYLYSQEKTDFYHSLPMRREGLFMAQFLSGFSLFLIPYVLNLLLTLAIGLVYGAVNQTALSILGIHTLLAVIYFLAIYGAAVLAILLTGNLFTGTLGFMTLMFYGPILYMTFTRLNARFFETIVQEMDYDFGIFLSPLIAYISGGTVDWTWKSLCIYFLYGVVLALVVILADILVYRIRPSESFHKAIAFKKLEPVIKVCGILPLSLLCALYFSGYMYNQFFWMVIGAVVLTLIFSMIFDFLCNMDIRMALKPKVSTGVILAVLILILGGYRTDITGVDTFLPDEEKVASMSLYLPSVSGQFQYPESSVTESPTYTTFSLKQWVEDFQEIYALAEKSVEYVRNHEAYASDVQSLRENGDPEQTMVMIYIGYHMKSGQDVYRMYYIPETEELVENIGRVYDTWEYREKILPTSYIDTEKIENIYTYSFTESGKALTLSDENKERLMKTYQEELENMTFDQSRREKQVGWLELQEKAEPEISAMGYSVNSTYTYSYNLPVYESFEKTRAMLEKLGNPMTDSIESDQVESILVSRYSYESGEEQYLEKEYRTKEDIEKLLAQATFRDERFTVGSHVNYQVSCEITWKDSKKDKIAFYIFEDSSLTDILEQLNQGNTD